MAIGNAFKNAFVIFISFVVVFRAFQNINNALSTRVTLWYRSC